jgi:hypothetical protein
MKKYEKYFTIEKTEELGVKTITHKYKSTDLRYAYSPKIIDNTRVALKFENGTYHEAFPNIEERNKFLKLFKQKFQEANTYGKD